MEIEPLSPQFSAKRRPLLYALAGACAFAFIFFICDLTLKPNLQDSGAGFIEAIQTSRTKFGDVFFVILSDLSLIIILAFPTIDYLLVDSLSGFKGIALALHIIYFTDILKMLYSDPRPYWKYDAVDGVKCSGGWGNPSGHASLSMGVLVYYSLRISKAKGKGYIVWSVCVLSLALVGLDRLYLGVHFYSQLMLGWALSLCFTLAYVFYDPLVTRLYNASLYLFQSISFWVVHMAVTSGVTLLIYFLRDPTWSANWTDNIDEDCDKDISKNSTETESIVEAAAICFVAGLAVSLYFCDQIGKRNWLISTSLRHSIIKVIFVVLFAGSFLAARVFFLGYIPTSTGKFFVSAILSFISGALVNFGILISSFFANEAYVSTLRDSPNESLRNYEQ